MDTEIWISCSIYKSQKITFLLIFFPQASQTVESTLDLQSTLKCMDLSQGLQFSNLSSSDCRAMHQFQIWRNWGVVVMWEDCVYSAVWEMNFELFFLILRTGYRAWHISPANVGKTSVTWMICHLPSAELSKVVKAASAFAHSELNWCR